MQKSIGTKTRANERAENAARDQGVPKVSEYCQADARICSQIHHGLTPLICLIASILFELTPISAQAELRAFQLKITNITSGNIRYVTSRLDDLQYPGYFPLAQNEIIEIEKTWMCYDRTDYANTLCEAPTNTTNSTQENSTQATELTQSLKTK